MSLWNTPIPRPRNTPKNFVEIKAGKMILQSDKMVYPDTRKGILYVYQNGESMMHFCWKDRRLTQAEDDLIIFPGDCEYLRVPQCTTGRVYVLKFKFVTIRKFYWLQEPKTDKDDEHCSRINHLLNHPPKFSIPGMFFPPVSNNLQTSRIFGNQIETNSETTNPVHSSTKVQQNQGGVAAETKYVSPKPTIKDSSGPSNETRPLEEKTEETDDENGKPALASSKFVRGINEQKKHCGKKVIINEDKKQKREEDDDNEEDEEKKVEKK